MSQQSGSSTANDWPDAVFLEAAKLAGELLAERSRIWPGQTRGQDKDPAMKDSWADAIVESGLVATRDGNLLMRELIAWPQKQPYPPDLGALIHAVLEQVVSYDYARKSFHKVLSCISARNYSRLSREEYWAFRQWPGGSWALLRTQKNEHPYKHWQQLLLEARRQGELPAPPAPGQKRLPRKVDEAKAEQQLRNIRRMLDGKN